ncbi:MAG: helix-turn-helix domain-containing protein [Pseudonocardia sp.]
MTSTDEHDDQQQRRQVADRVLYWTRRRGLTRQVFADHLGKSLSWVDKIKNGDRQLDRLSVLRRIAHVLDVPLAVLIDLEVAEQNQLCPDEREIDAIRTALRRYDVITNIFRPNGDVLPEPNLDRLAHTVRYGWTAFQVSNYAVIGRLLPDLIRDAQAAVWQLDAEERRNAQFWLAWTYQLAASAAFKLGDAPLGWLAADRGIQIAEQTEDLTLIGHAARRVAHALFATHHGSDAVELVRSAASRLAPNLATADPAFLSAYGSLLLKGSIAAARLHQAADVRDLQSEALTVARRLGPGSNENWSAFGVTNVRVHQVSALADMHSGGRVLEAADIIPLDDLYRLPKERRATHLLDVTRGYLQAGRRDEAATTLLDAHQLAPEEVRCRQKTNQTVTDLVRSYPHNSSAPIQLIRVAEAIGIPV